MPDARRKQGKTEAERREEKDRRARALGHDSFAAYLAFCREHGLSLTLEKSKAEHQAEKRAVKDKLASQALATTRRLTRDPGAVIQRLHDGGSANDYPPNHPLWVVKQTFDHCGTAYKRSVLELLLQVERHADLLNSERGIPVLGAQADNNFASAVCALAKHAGSWLRPVAHWKPRSHNRRRQFAELARHLLATWEVPAFMDSAFFEGTGVEAVRRQCWFLHLGAGKNIRSADVPLTLTSRMAHHFLQAPPESTVLEALRWGQVHGLGGDARLARAVIGTRLREDFNGDAFWNSVLVFLVGSPMLDTARIGPLVDYLYALKFGPEATEPDFTMKGRTVTALMRRVEEWHEQITQEKQVRKGEWAPSGIEVPDYRYSDGRDPDGTHRIWTVTELRTARSLSEEGQAMHHCVGTYSYSCSAGRTSIWSLRRKDAAGYWRILTVEVENRTRRVVQARGIANRSAGAVELRVLKDWAARARLDVASFL